MKAAGGGATASVFASGLDGFGGDVLTWPLAGDPSIRWQVLADLLGASQEEIDTEQARVAVQRWGARLLVAQCAPGRWGDGLYGPKWTSPTYTVPLLCWLGLPRGNSQAVTGCRPVWDGARFLDGGLTLAKSLRHVSRRCWSCWRLHSATATIDWIPRSNASVTDRWQMAAGTVSWSARDRDTAR